MADHKIRKTGETLEIKLVETVDIVAQLGQQKRPGQWTVGFALETDDARFRAITKLERKSCDLVVLNGVAAISAADNSVEMIAPDGQVLGSFSGKKQQVADSILSLIQERLITSSNTLRSS